VTGIVLDTGALLALERASRRTLTEIATAREQRDPVVIPAGCVAQAWRDGAQQVRLALLLKSRATTIEPLDERLARRIGELLRASGTADIVDAHVAFIATRDQRVIYTSDPDDLRRLAPSADIEAV
jgi:hypothetical protein